MKRFYKISFRRCYDIKMNFGDTLDLVGIPVVRRSFPGPVNAICEEGGWNVK